VSVASPAERPLAGRIAFVTGAARGIGRGIALALAEGGADVVVADLHPAPFKGERYFRLRERWSGAEEDTSTVEAVRELGRRSLEIELDVSDPGAATAAARRAQEELGAVDVLVNNAGIVNNIAPIAAMQPEAWEHELRVNLSGAFHCVRALVPSMAERGFGRVVNIASVAAVQPVLSQPAYSASKAGLVAFTRSVAQEFGARRVTANAVLPGLIATPLAKSMPEKIRARVTEHTALGRLGEPREIGALVAFLASPGAGFITGTAIPCDGGMLGAPSAGMLE
jgi:NAD(P)-dependent dehydrogenase (short-subunit alcohol dehydrogenase family)